LKLLKRKNKMSAFPSPYYPQVFAVKALIQHEDKYLLIKEPPTASWKPGKWGIPGGKIDQGEDWLTALHREIKEELGQPIQALGIIAFEEIVYFNPKVQEHQLTHHIVVLAKLNVADPLTAELACEHTWLTLPELLGKSVDDLAEFYFPSLWQRVSQPHFALMPMESVLVWDETKVSAFKEWYKK
jgi:ADP-ribose pyrophosphatase YjhB (NUDIX family)